MRKNKSDKQSTDSQKGAASLRSLNGSASSNKEKMFPVKLISVALTASFIFASLALGVFVTTLAKNETKTPKAVTVKPQDSKSLAGQTYTPMRRDVASSPINFAEAAQQEALEPAKSRVSEIRSIEPPKDKPERKGGSVPINPDALEQGKAIEAPTPSSTGTSPGPAKSFKGEFLNGTTIPPDTMGAVGTTHIVTVSNDRLRIQDRNGVEISRLTINSFWSTATVKGVAVASAFDTKAYFDRFNNRFILISSLNGASINSGMGVAVTATADPTGTWYRYTAASDPSSTATAGHAIDYPSVGFNKNWIVVGENTFNFSGSAFTTYYGQQIFVFDKQAAYSNTLSTINLFEGTNASCNGTNNATNLGCGFTMAPSVVEDNTTDNLYLAEDWDSTAAQLRLSKITGTPSTPALTVGTQFPQSTNSWRFTAARIGTANNCGGTCSGGYAPMRQQSANLISGTRLANNDSRIQNTVLRNGTLWATHTVMLSTTPQTAGTTIGGTGNPIDNHAAIQWWAIDPTIETGLSTLPIQRGRIEDSTANNCHNGNGGTSAVAPCNGTALVQFGTFFAFPNITVNQNNDVLIGFTQFSPFTYPSAAYAIRRSTDPFNTMRDPVVFKPGQSNYNIGSGSGTSRQNRWGDYSGAQTDPLDDTNFWTIQEYAGTNRNDFLAPSYAGPWETWWAQVNPAAAAPSTSGGLIISEFRLRGPQGVRDEYVELYNPNDTPVYVNTTDNSDGWALVFSANGTAVTSVFAVIPNGTVIPARGHFLVADNPDNTGGGTSALTYSLNGYAGLTNPASQVRGSDSDTGWSFDLADNGGIAIFKTATTANFTAGNLMDSAGFSGIAAGLFKEGNGIPAVTAATPTGQMAFVRKLTTGTPQDTGANEADFRFVDTALETLTETPYLGAAGPENLDSPIKETAVTINGSLVDSGCAATAFNPASPTACAFERNSTPVTNGALGTLSIRRQFTNNTGQPITRLRFRVADISGPTNQAVGVADLRLLTSSTVTGNLSGGGTTTIQGLTLETPPTQANGGGINSSVNAGIITLGAPLANGASINVQFQLGVQTSGTFNFCVISESLPSGGSNPVCYSGNADGTGLGPTITTTGTLVDFGSVSVGSFSAPQSYTVSGTNLADNITVTAPTDFQVSTSMGSGFGSSVTLTQAGGTVPTTTIYVRFAPTSPGLKSGNVTNASSGATTQNVAVSGTGVAVCSSGITVINTADSGAGSLRQAVIDVCAGGTINFDTAGVFATPQTITLTSGEIVIGKNLTITGTGASMLTVSGNNASRIFSISSGPTVNISGLTLTGGNGVGAALNNNGGAILNISGTLNLSSSVLSGNSVTSTGGAIHINAGVVMVTNSTISGNTSGSFGGGIRVNGGSLNVTGSTISGNTTNASSSAGGGIDASSGITVTNSTISGNSATGSSGSNGGGIWVSANSTITNCTITNNSAAGGSSAGGLRRAGNTITVRNSIVAANQNNTTTPDVFQSAAGAFSSSGYNLIGNVGTVTDFNQPTDQTGTGASPLDPKLAPLALNGGTTQTHKLKALSPALDKGLSFGSTTDQRGLTRPVDLPSVTNAASGDGSDIGAYEAQTLPNKTPLDFDGDGKSDYAVIQGVFPRANIKNEKVKEIKLEGDLLADDNQRYWTSGYNKLLHLRAGRGFIELPEDVRQAELRRKQERGDVYNIQAIEGLPIALNWLIRRSSDGATLNYALGTNTDEFVPADYDGDGKTDAAVWNATTGFTVILSSTLSPVTYSLGIGNMNADPTVVGDYDGDGIDDPAVYDPTTGVWSWMGGATHATNGSVTWLANGIPAPGDYNGDGKTDFAIQIPPNASPDSAKFRIAFNDGSVGPAADISLTYGLAVYTIVPGDYDGDGKTDIAQVNMTGTTMGWRYLTSSSNYTLQVKRNFGAVSTDRMVQGDYDGDGKIDLAIYRRASSPADGVFIVFQSSTNTQSAPFDWGDADDYPVGFYNSH